MVCSISLEKKSQRRTRLREGEGKLIWPRLAEVECALSVNSSIDTSVYRCKREVGKVAVEDERCVEGEKRVGEKRGIKVRYVCILLLCVVSVGTWE